jgi:hypothetical protein
MPTRWRWPPEAHRALVGEVAQAHGVQQLEGVGDVFLAKLRRQAVKALT